MNRCEDHYRPKYIKSLTPKQVAEQNRNNGINLLYVIRRNWTEWVVAFPTLVEAQARFDMLKAERPEWNLQIVCEEQ